MEVFALVAHDAKEILRGPARIRKVLPPDAITGFAKGSSGLFDPTTFPTFLAFLTFF
jgi:hypothetical protein